MTDTATATPATEPTTVPDIAPPPAPVVANAGAAVVTTEAATYRFNGEGPSLVSDAVAAQSGDTAAAGRLARFNAELLNRNASTELAMAAVLVRDPMPDSMVPNQGTRTPVSVALSTRRPLADRSTNVPIKNAQPFYAPVIGDFVGVAAHTEGTPHVTEGTISLADSLVTPTASSGAFRMAREAADSSSPAIDVLALNAMVDDYGKVTEAKIAAALAAGAGSTANNVNTVAEVRAVLIDILGTTDGMPESLVLSSGLYADLADDADTTGRPFFSYVPAVNSAASGVLSGNTGASVDGVGLALSSKIANPTGYAFDKIAVLWAESPVQQFKFEQPEGPGIIKLAVFGYSAAKVLLSARVKKITSAAP